MARPVSWLPRLPEILRLVSNSVRTHYDRPAVQRLFQIQKRAANQIMDLMPKERPLGASHLVTSEELLCLLKELQAAADVDQVFAARRAVEAKVSHRTPRRTLVRRELVEEGSLATLPQAITLEPGRLSVTFQTFPELMEALAAIAGVLDNDLQAFMDRCVPVSEEELRHRAEAQGVQAMLRKSEEEFSAWMATKRATREAASAQTQILSALAGRVRIPVSPPPESDETKNIQ